MLDIKIIRENPDKVRKGLAARGGRSLPDFENVLKKDREWRAVLKDLDQLRAKRNQAADLIGKLKREKKDASPLIKEMDGLKGAQKEKEEKERALRGQTELLLLNLPNLPEASVPFGRSATENKVIHEEGAKPEFSFRARDHHELGLSLGIIDFDIATRLSGSRFTLLAREGARLERAIAQFMLDLHTKENGYDEYVPPYLVTEETITGTGQLPKFADEVYRCKDDDLYLIPTAEVPLANLFRDRVLDENELPYGATAYTPCFRREAGSYGKDTRGLIRNHQFSKVELVRFCRMEDSLSELEKLTQHAESVLKKLELPFRRVLLCSFDMGFAATKTYDLEVWMPGEGMWREISSCSTCGDFQARRINFKVKKDKRREFGCTLNGSGLAIGRTLAAILENGQQEDGIVLLPKALHPAFGTDRIKTRRNS